MAIDLARETLITPAQYAKMRPSGRNGRPMALTTAYRHIFQGVRGTLLEHVRFGGNIYTSVEAVQRFCDRLTAAETASATTPVGSIPSTSPLALRTPTARCKAVEQAERELDQIGI
jgi:hypothetical protein